MDGSSTEVPTLTLGVCNGVGFREETGVDWIGLVGSGGTGGRLVGMGPDPDDGGGVAWGSGAVGVGSAGVGAAVAASAGLSAGGAPPTRKYIEDSGR